MAKKKAAKMSNRQRIIAEIQKRGIDTPNAEIAKTLGVRSGFVATVKSVIRKSGDIDKPARKSAKASAPAKQAKAPKKKAARSRVQSKPAKKMIRDLSGLVDACKIAKQLIHAVGVEDAKALIDVMAP